MRTTSLRLLLRQLNGDALVRRRVEAALGHSAID
jgi:hypothetical protein